MVDRQGKRVSLQFRFWTFFLIIVGGRRRCSCGLTPSAKVGASAIFTMDTLKAIYLPYVYFRWIHIIHVLRKIQVFKFNNNRKGQLAFPSKLLYNRDLLSQTKFASRWTLTKHSTGGLHSPRSLRVRLVAWLKFPVYSTFKSIQKKDRLTTLIVVTGHDQKAQMIRFGIPFQPAELSHSQSTGCYMSQDFQGVHIKYISSTGMEFPFNRSCVSSLADYPRAYSFGGFHLDWQFWLAFFNGSHIFTDRRGRRKNKWKLNLPETLVWSCAVSKSISVKKKWTDKE